MLPVSIDMSNFIEMSAISPEDVSGFKSMLLDRLEKGFKEKWEDEVVSNLHSTRAEYIRGMYTTRDDNSVTMGVIATRSKLAVNLELGMPPFDEKAGFALSPKRTMKKDGKGWYLTIPFRSATSSALGESPAFTNVMPAAIERLAKKATKPLKLAQLPIGYQGKGIRPGINIGNRSYRAYQHKSARYEGLVRMPDKDENRGGYMTFRRVSDLSDWNSWIHPGFMPYGLLNKALNKISVSSIVRLAKMEYFNNR